MTRWSERPVNVCASWRADRWVNVTCMNRNSRGSGVDGQRLIKRKIKGEAEKTTTGIKMVRGPGNLFPQQVMLL